MTSRTYRYGRVLFLLITSLVFNGYTLTPNPILSRNAPVFGSSPNNAELLVNGKYGEWWTVSDGSWVAINVGEGYTKVFVNWNNVGGSWSDSIAAAMSCKNNMSIPIDYDILTSPNSTDGSDGDWTTALTVRNNTVTARAHAIDFTGAQWVKIVFIKGSGALDEVEVFDISNGYDDTWFFPGTSISAVGYKSNAPEKNFADLVHEAHSAFTPAIIRGGIGCIKSITMADDISRYLAMAGNVSFWAIEMGTNDAWGGGDYFLPEYIESMQLIIDSCKANNIQPVIARIIGTDSAKTGWQVNPGFLRAIDSLAEENDLVPGPDFYTYFKNHPEELSDGVHPTATGGATMFRLWAEKMGSLYTASGTDEKQMSTSGKTVGNRVVMTNGSGCGILRFRRPGTVLVYSIKGELLEKQVVSPQESVRVGRENGCYVVEFRSRSERAVVSVLKQF